MLRPFFTYFGAKWRLAAHYPQPAYDIIEPFAGSACYALRHPEGGVTLYDLDETICGIWEWLVRASDSDIRDLPDDVIAVADLPSGVPQGARDLIGFWLTRGATRPAKRVGGWMQQGRWPNQFWGTHVKERIRRQVPAIRHWKIINESYTKCPDVKATWFIDPPYEDQGKHYRYNEIDHHNHLRDWVLSRQGQIIVCEQKGAEWLKFETFGSVKSTRGKTNEVVFIRGGGL